MLESSGYERNKVRASSLAFLKAMNYSDDEIALLLGELSSLSVDDQVKALLNAELEQIKLIGGYRSQSTRTGANHRGNSPFSAPAQDYPIIHDHVKL